MKKNITMYAGVYHGSFDTGLKTDKAIDFYLRLRLKYKIVAIAFIEYYDTESEYEKRYLRTKKPSWI